MTDTTSDAPEPQAPVDARMSSEEAVLALTEGGDEKEQDQTADAPPADEEVDPLLAVLDEDATTGDPAEAPAIEAPKSWGEEGRAKFAALPRDLQEYVLARETERDSAAHKALGEATAAKKSAQQDASQIAQLRARLDEIVPQALQTFRSRWEGIDWAAEAQRDPAATFQAKQIYEAEQAQLQKLSAAQAEAQQTEHRQHVLNTSEELARIAPDLTDPKEGPARVSALAGFLREQGIGPEQLQWASATELALAYDALRYRQLQAKAKDAITRNPSAPMKPVKPAGAGDRGSSETNAVSTAKRRLAQTGRADDAVAVIQALGL